MKILSKNIMVMFRKKNRTTSRNVIARPTIWTNLANRYISLSDLAAGTQPVGEAPDDIIA